MAKIELKPDNIECGIWWLVWADRNEVIGSVLRETDGYHFAPHGPHWSPMKRFGRSFQMRDAALADVQLYFRGR